MKKTTINTLWILGVSALISPAELLTPSAVSGTGTYNNSPSLLADGVFPAERSTWTDSTNVWWRGTTPAFTFDYGALYEVDDVTLSVDNNDDYLIESSKDGSNWSTLFTIAKGDGEQTFGMDTMSTDNTNGEYIISLEFKPVEAQFLRIAATGGDDRYSIGEFQANGSRMTVVPEPSGAIALAGLIGFSLFGRTRR